METLFGIFRVDHWGEFWWVMVGFAGQALFSMRFLIQWIMSERARQSVMPIAFWYFSLAGGVVLLSYAIYRRDPVFMLGQSMGLIVYVPQPLADPCRQAPGLRRGPSRSALAGIALVTLWRVALLPLVSADLFVDDAQYWFWGQELAWGYYSKPPLIGWILRASTEIGSDAPFWIRLPMPLIHAATAVVVALVARRLYGGAHRRARRLRLRRRSPASRSAACSSRPTRRCSSASRSALLAQLHLAERRSLGWALVLGAAVGVGLLAKYAMIYFPLSAALAALVAAVGAHRLARRRRSPPSSRWRSSRRTSSGTPRTTSRRCSTPPRTPAGRDCGSTSWGSPSSRRAVRHVGAGLLRRLPGCGSPGPVARSDAALPGA